MIVYPESRVYRHLLDASVPPREALGALMRIHEDGPAIPPVPVDVEDEDNVPDTFIAEGEPRCFTAYVDVLTFQEINTIRSNVGLLPLPLDTAALTALFGPGFTIADSLHEGTQEKADLALTIRHEERERTTSH